MFRNRAEAGALLADALRPLLVAHPAVIAAIPCGGVAVALPIAERLGVPITVTRARKLTAPVAPRLAFGAVDEDGAAVLDPAMAAVLGIAPEDADRAKARVAAEIARSRASYAAPPLEHYLPGDVVLVDDGVMTGLTMRAAVSHARRHGAQRITVAVPCAAAEAAARLARDVDRLVALVVDDDFVAVGDYYLDFEAVPPDLVRLMLGTCEADREAGARHGEVIADARDAGRPVLFENRRGARLSGTLFVPPATTRAPLAVFARPSRARVSDGDRAAARALGRDGIAAFLLDFPTGHGVDDAVDDLRSALWALDEVDAIDATRLAFVGIGAGAVPAMTVAAEHPAARTLVLRAPRGGGEVVAERVRVPTLLVVGEHDAAGRAAGARLVDRLPGRRGLAVVPGGDAAFDAPASQAAANALTVDWLRESLAPLGTTA